jgi:hypothetical protein
MAQPLIASIRTRTDLKRTVKHTAVEMAHMCSIYGVLRKSLSYIATKCECSKKTVIAHLKILIALKIIVRIRRRIPGTYRHEMNEYRFLIPWHGKPPALHKRADSEENSLNLPTPPKEIPEVQLLEGMKEGKFADLIRGKLRVLHHMMTEGSQWYQQLKEEIDTLIQESRWCGADLDTLLQET